jgi:hypothetical protein
LSTLIYHQSWGGNHTSQSCSRQQFNTLAPNYFADNLTTDPEIICHYAPGDYRRWGNLDLIANNLPLGLALNSGQSAKLDLARNLDCAADAGRSCRPKGYRD